jgi:beta-ketoacyl synthase-like protein
MTETTTDQRTLLEHALRELREARRRLTAAEEAGREPVAVLGASVRMPGGISGLEQLWSGLRDGIDAVTPLINSVDGHRHGNSVIAENDK